MEDLPKDPKIAGLPMTDVNQYRGRVMRVKFNHWGKMMKIRYLLSVAALTVLAGIASAGYIGSEAVVVDLEDRLAYGDQLTARNSKNHVEMIGCGIRVFDNGVDSWSWGFCKAVDSAEVEIVCTTENANLLDAMKATSAFALIMFEWQDDGEGGAVCTTIGFSTQSFYLPNFTIKEKK